MRKIYAVLAASLAACPLNALAQAVDPKPVAAGRSEDAKAIKALDDAFAKAVNAGDAKAIAPLLTEDAEASDESGSTIRGREPVMRHFAEAIAADPKATIELTTESLRFLGPDAARETGRCRTTPGNGGSVEISRYTVFFVKKDGRWLQDIIQESSDRDASAHDRLAELEWLVGDWVDESPDAVVRTSCRWSEDKNYLLRDFTMQVGGQPVSSGSQRIGWDARLGKFRSWVFDADGGHSEGVWTRTGKDQWVVRAVGVLADGRGVSATQVYTHVNKGQARWKSIDRTIEGQAIADLPEIVMVVTPPKAAGSSRPSK